MPSSNVSFPLPLTRWPVFWPGQWGVRGSDNKLGARMHTEGAVYYVSPNHPDCSDTGDGTNPDQPLVTVAAALALCQPMRGDVVAVMANNAWQYHAHADGYLLPINENVIVTVPGVRIIGVHPSASTGVVWQPATDGGTCITVNALDVSIEGFAFTEGIRAGCNAIKTNWDGVTEFGDSTTICHCLFDPSVDVGISMDFNWYADIHDNVFWQCDDTGIQLIDPGHGAPSYLTIHRNMFHDCVNHAMDLPHLVDSFIYQNAIYNTNAATPIAATDEGILTTGGGGNTVHDNWFSCPLAAVPGGWADFNTASATDAWINNHCMTGDTITNP